ncbi:glycine--tRNA ligase [Kamptonema cortianum]|nr:glycine--tRNA ligase [Kamptonema cortianum]MDL5050077.1 glycine--tRNA ligase [Oscillatoria amoena NRMC-F 0135]
MSEDSKNNQQLMEKIVALCKRRGFIFQSSEIYGGINGFWDYGPLGAELKRNTKDYWWKCMTQWREDIVGIDATIIMHPDIWKASGHVDTFSDPMCDCLLTKKRFRADQIDPQSGIVYSYTGAKDNVSGKTCDDSYSVLLFKGKPPESARKVAVEFYKMRGLSEPELLGETTAPIENTIRYNPDNGSLLSEPRPFNLMFQSHAGPIQSDENKVYLRPETAQAIFVQFKNVLETSRMKVPFGIAQVGKAFRNEVTPRNFTFRSREFEQMELEFFIKPDEIVTQIAGDVASADENTPLPEPQPNWGWQAWHIYWVQQRLNWYEAIGLNRDTLELYWQKKDELAHYARACVDILYKFPFGTQELEGIAARGAFDLTQHQEHSGKSMEYFDEEAKSRYVPHVIEPSAGADRLVLALICNAYHEEDVTDEKGKTETRVVMKFHPRVAPFKAAVFPLLKNKPELVAKAREVLNLLRPHMNVFYDDAGAIGRRYRRQDEAGTPFCVTIDFETIEGIRTEGTDQGLKNTVTVRHRDSMRQERVPVDKLLGFLQEQIA